MHFMYYFSRRSAFYIPSLCHHFELRFTHIVYATVLHLIGVYIYFLLFLLLSVCLQFVCEEAGTKLEGSELDSRERVQITRLSTVPAGHIVYGQQLTTSNGSSANIFIEEGEMVPRSSCISKMMVVITVSAISLCIALLLWLLL